MKAWMKITTSVLFLRPTQESLETPISSQTVVKPLGASAGFFSSMDNRKTRGKGTWKRTIFCRSHHLDKLGVGKQLLLPHAYFQVGEPVDQQGAASSSAQASRYLPSGKKPPRTEVMDGTMEASYGWRRRKRRRRRRAWFWRRWDAGWWR